MEKPSSGTGISEDDVLLILTALLVCVTGGFSILLADIWHINIAWVFAAWNSIGVVFLFIEDFGRRVREPSFAVFLGVWALLHGALVVILMRWMPALRMIPYLIVEMLIGYVLADLIFDIRPLRKIRQVVHSIGTTTT